MAIAYFNIVASKVTSSALAKHNYNSAKATYEKKSDVISTTDFNMPQLTSGQEVSGWEFWKSCDENERKNANLFKEFVVALPLELNREQNAELIDKFVQEFIPNQPASISFHAGKNGDQPHVHAQFSMRANDNVVRENLGQFFKRANKKNPEKGGAPKVDNWRGQEFIIDARKRWETLCNNHLEACGSDARIEVGDRSKLKGDNPNRS